MEKYCEICPRKCRADRISKFGFCGQSNTVKVAKVMLHKWEEPIISGENGSGAIFFSGCNLKCIYCQNYQISSFASGKEITIQKLADIFKQLEEKGANNINLVTPTHFTNQIIEALKIYKPKIPIVWNTSGYESTKTIKKLKKYVDIYLTDLKYYSRNLSTEYSCAVDYFDRASEAILEMRKNQPQDVIENGLMKKGLIVRHLVLPKTIFDTKAVLNWIDEKLGNQTIVSLMGQYIPCHLATKHKILKHKLSKKEYDQAIFHLLDLGFEKGFVQELSSSSKNFIPDFNCQDTEFDF